MLLLNRWVKNKEEFKCSWFLLKWASKYLLAWIKLKSSRSAVCLFFPYQCDQIWRFIGLWATFSSLWQLVIGPNLTHSKAIFLKCQNLSLFEWNHFWAIFIDIWRSFSGHTCCCSKLRKYENMKKHVSFQFCLFVTRERQREREGVHQCERVRVKPPVL